PSAKNSSRRLPACPPPPPAGRPPPEATLAGLGPPNASAVRPAAPPPGTSATASAGCAPGQGLAPRRAGPPLRPGPPGGARGGPPLRPPSCGRESRTATRARRAPLPAPAPRRLPRPAWSVLRAGAGGPRAAAALGPGVLGQGRRGALSGCLTPLVARRVDALQQFGLAPQAGLPGGCPHAVESVGGGRPEHGSSGG